MSNDEIEQTLKGIQLILVQSTFTDTMIELELQVHRQFLIPLVSNFSGQSPEEVSRKILTTVAQLAHQRFAGAADISAAATVPFSMLLDQWKKARGI